MDRQAMVGLPPRKPFLLYGAEDVAAPHDRGGGIMIEARYA
jgi:hypothetical protein